MQTILFHPDAAACEALERMTQRLDDVTVLCASCEELFESGLMTEGAVVSPGNGFGIMDGGFDGVLRALCGDLLEARIKRQIVERYGPELPVGAAVAARSEHGQLVIYAPTMQIPMRIVGTDNVYRAARAAANKAVYIGVDVLYMPLLGTDTGGMALEDAAVQILAGVHDGVQPIAPEDMTWAHADRLHMQWHRFCGVPDDGFRMAEIAAHRKEEDDATAVDDSQGG
ncbi:MAG: macro domain-containing protein [Candidatus Ventricola sp.]